LGVSNPAVRAVFLELETTPPAYKLVPELKAGSTRVEVSEDAAGPLAESFFRTHGSAWDAVNVETEK
jgi:hypothetical protein